MAYFQGFQRRSDSISSFKIFVRITLIRLNGIKGDCMEKKKYIPPEIEEILFGESFIRTSFGNDGNFDEDWDDENANPIVF